LFLLAAEAITAGHHPAGNGTESGNSWPEDILAACNQAAVRNMQTSAIDLPQAYLS